MRKKLWYSLGIAKNKIEDVNPEIYVNHTWLKKFGTPLFVFNSKKENVVLRSKDGSIPENEYHISSKGVFESGIIKVKDWKWKQYKI